jgi:hypothetical protein
MIPNCKNIRKSIQDLHYGKAGRYVAVPAFFGDAQY